jgi:polysaccharide biosynthesis protein PslH
MRILFLTQLFPYPATNGGKLKTLKLIRHLSKEHQIYLLCFTDKKITSDNLNKVKKYCHCIKVIYKPLVNIRYKDELFKVLFSVFCLKPTVVWQYCDNSMKNMVEKLAAKNSFKLVYIEYLSMCQYLNNIFKTKKTKLIYGEHNINWLSRFRLFKQQKNLFKKTFFLIEAVKLYFYERKYIPKFDKILFISPKDKQELSKLGADKNKLYFLPTIFQPKPVFKFKKNRHNIIFLGLLSWEPNKDGFYWFYYNIFPKILSHLPHAKLWVVGSEAEAKMKDLAKQDKNLRLTGYVKNLDLLFKQAGAFVAPIRSGSGLRVKVLQALSFAMPMIATSTAIEGLNLENNKELMVANRADDFSKKTCQVLTSQKLAENLSLNSLKFIKKYNKNNKFRQALTKVFKI